MNDADYAKVAESTFSRVKELAQEPVTSSWSSLAEKNGVALHCKQVSHDFIVFRGTFQSCISVTLASSIILDKSRIKDWEVAYHDCHILKQISEELCIRQVIYKTLFSFFIDTTLVQLHRLSTDRRQWVYAISSVPYPKVHFKKWNCRSVSLPVSGYFIRALDDNSGMSEITLIHAYVPDKSVFHKLVNSMQERVMNVQTFNLLERQKFLFDTAACCESACIPLQPALGDEIRFMSEDLQQTLQSEEFRSILTLQKPGLGADCRSWVEPFSDMKSLQEFGECMSLSSPSSNAENCSSISGSSDISSSPTARSSSPPSLAPSTVQPPSVGTSLPSDQSPLPVPQPSSSPSAESDASVTPPPDNLTASARSMTSVSSTNSNFASAMPDGSGMGLLPKRKRGRKPGFKPVKKKPTNVAVKPTMKGLPSNPSRDLYSFARSGGRSIAPKGPFSAPPLLYPPTPTPILSHDNLSPCSTRIETSFGSHASIMTGSSTTSVPPAPAPAPAAFTPLSSPSLERLPIAHALSTSSSSHPALPPTIPMRSSWPAGGRNLYDQSTAHASLQRPPSSVPLLVPRPSTSSGHFSFPPAVATHSSWPTGAGNLHDHPPANTSSQRPPSPHPVPLFSSRPSSLSDMNPQNKHPTISSNQVCPSSVSSSNQVWLPGISLLMNPLHPSSSKESSLPPMKFEWPDSGLHRPVTPNTRQVFCGNIRPDGQGASSVFATAHTMIDESHDHGKDPEQQTAAFLLALSNQSIGSRAPAPLSSRTTSSYSSTVQPPLVHSHSTPAPHPNEVVRLPAFSTLDWAVDMQADTERDHSFTFLNSNSRRRLQHTGSI
mmetsp:Transcript_36239/g.58548  ORF Transcript_36239/g.58548 Transcript_36239/m.58548 type:complete len:830 (-) Transcript_36239:79-2568(-)